MHTLSPTHRTRPALGMIRRSLALITVLVLTACGGNEAPTPTTVPTEPPAATATTAPPRPTATKAPPRATATKAPPRATATKVPPRATATEDVPPTVEGPIPSSTPDEADTGIKILEFHDYNSSADSKTVYVVGTIKNTFTGPLDHIKVTAEITDKDNTTVATGEDLLLSLVQLDPDQVAPFQVLLTGVTDDGENVDVRVNAKEVDTTFQVFPPSKGLQIVKGSDKLTPAGDFSGPKILGRVKNGGNKDATLVGVLAIAYDADGKVVDTEKGYLTGGGDLTAGKEAPFSIEFNRPDVKIDHYDIRPVGVEK